MRILLFGLGTLLAFGCKGGSPTSTTSSTSAQAFLPTDPDLAVRIDLERARKWPHFGKAATLLARDVQPILDEIKAACGLDPVAESKSVFVARRQSAELAIIVGGLAKDRVHACAGPERALRLDGDLLSVHRDAKAIASGKFLGSGELVLLSRAGGALDDAAWKTAQTSAARPPSWVTQLDPSSVAAAWLVHPTRKVLARTDLGDPTVVRGTLTSESLETAKRDQQLVFATGEYFKTADAGSMATAINGSSVEVTLEVKGEQVPALLRLVAPLLGGGSEVAVVPAAPPASSGSGSALADATPDPHVPTKANVPGADLAIAPEIPVDCEGVRGAVSKYLDASIASAAAPDRAGMQRVALQLRPEMEKIFYQRCISDQWTIDGIRCHIAAAYNNKLRLFEQCPLSAPQRTALDRELAAAMQKVGVAPVTKEAVLRERGSASGSGAAPQ